MTNKYLEKIAGIKDLAKAYAGHVTGKTLQKAESTKAVLDGFSNASKAEHATHAEMSGMYHSAGDAERMSAEFNKHKQRMAGQNAASSGVFEKLKETGHLHTGSNDLGSLRMKKNIAQAGTALGVAGLVHGAYKAGKNSSNK